MTKSSRLVRLSGNPALEKQLEASVRERLQNRRKLIPGFPDLWKQTIDERPKKMQIPAYLTFRLLHRQFAGSGVPGLPQGVRLARQLVKALREKAPW